MNPFNIFDLPVDFHVDQATLSARYLALQKSLHPDNFTTHSAQEQRLAMQRSAEVNDALQILKDPILRAETIIAIYTGEQQNIEENSTRDMAFLMQQMQWREQLENIEAQQDSDQLVAFSADIEKTQQALLSELADALSSQQWQQAKVINDKLRFIKKLLLEVERVEEKLLDF
ncbi:Fe-S protein assembly co-chaperone HscB [Pasteurella multocida]|uniref:Fe-S protein assembly co-chaperone HscB n=1 Tax=Pasteurella multocida TaxID=747 RepID=UPI0002569D2B|nr:Fe-S protein assembly co-chaperone HscB [Pasteurella multocida]AFF23596.1 co-chaperone HscB [Pasteurella multocida subsp. multocida str. HN06]MBF6981925.1 Fe-S protein assembly co-chaperone HscB [Pasteurella multocida]MCL7775935.1 Fe-S protein assembly co-chaperone HscB [Pasteurella multocida]MCL8064680.1 Fe-S protein assembly co-chaperone HscB [Pasteurella multocida]MCL8065654.1 Fe-S protein assembly co-chaperone HscB [Pasteurella multocida]